MQESTSPWTQTDSIVDAATELERVKAALTDIKEYCTNNYLFIAKMPGNAETWRIILDSSNLANNIDFVPIKSAEDILNIITKHSAKLNVTTNSDTIILATTAD